MKTTVINIRSLSSDDLQLVRRGEHPEIEYIGRKNLAYGLPASIWGNPFIPGTNCKPEECLTLYRLHISTKPHLIANLPKLKGKKLACWCKVNGHEMCHGDVLIELAENPPALQVTTSSAPEFYIDPLMAHGWVLYGKPVDSCHLFTNGAEEELKAFAKKLGLRADWLQVSNSGIPHFDLVKSKRATAIKLGAIELSRAEAVGVWKTIREKQKEGTH